MVKALKKRFIFVAMAAVCVLLIVLLGAINIFNAVIVNNQVDDTISFLVQRGLSPMGNMPSGDRGGFPEKDFERNDFFRKPMNEDTFMSSRHFTVLLGENNEIVNINVSQISSVDSDEAEKIAQNMLSKNKFNGYTNGFRFDTAIADNEFTREHSQVMVFLDVTDQYRNIFSVLFLSVVLGAAAWGLMLLLVVALSEKAIKPIAENMREQKMFITNAGHEIKTPLAIILANTDALELHAGKSKWSENIRTQTNRLSGLMQNLLLLSKADEGVSAMAQENVNATEILNSVVEQYSELCSTEGKIILTEIEADCIVNAVSENLRQLFSVLVDNAVKYALPESNINIFLGKQNGKMIFRIKNKCTELPQVEPSKLFDRFYRGDSARTQKSGGYGIGLSVARAIAESSSGSIKANYLDDNIIEFVVEI